MKKRFIRMLPVLCMVFALFPSAASAAETGTPIGTASVTEGTPRAITGYSYDPGSTTLTISSNAGTTAWRDDSSFTTIQNDITTVDIQSGVTDIGASAFSDCTKLASVAIPSSVTTVGISAFNGCESLESVTFECATPPTFGTNVFIGTRYSLKIYVPTANAVIAYKNVANLATWRGNIEAVGAITGNGFSYDPGTTTLIISSDTGTTEWSNNGRVAGEEVTTVVIEKGVTTIGKRAFLGCTSLASVTIPEGVTTIDNDAFYGCTSLASVTIPSSVITIGNAAFHGCTGLTSVTIPEGVTTIDGRAFWGCTRLASVTIPKGVTTIGNSAFWGCTSLASVTISEGVTTIGGVAFDGCTGLTSVTIPSSVTTIDNYAFNGCTGLASVTIPEGVTTIGEGAFGSCTGLTSVTIPSSVTTIGNSAFWNCTSLASVTFECATPPAFGTNVFIFTRYSLKIYVPTADAVTAYKKVTNLASWKDKIEAVGGGTTATVTAVAVTPKTASVQKGNTQQFNASITGTNNPAQTVTWAVTGGTKSGTTINASGLLTVAADETATSLTVKATSTVDNTKSDTATITAIPKTVRTFTAGIYNYAVTSADGAKTATVELKSFARGKSASKVTVKKTVTYKGKTYNITGIADKAFYKNKNLREINISNSVTYIGKKAFYECTKLTNVILGNKVSKIEDHAFYKCTGLKKVTIGTGLKTIGKYVFYHDKKLTSLTIKSTKLTKVGKRNLYKCRNLKIKVPSSKVKAYTKFFKNQGQSSNVKVMK